MGLNYFYNSPSEGSGIYIPDRTLNFGTSINIEHLRTSSRKKSCDSNISNVSSIFQKTLNNHNRKKQDENNYSTISTNASISLLLNSEERKKRRDKTLIISPIKNKKDASFHLRQSYYQRLIHKNIETTNKSTIKNNTIFIFDWDDTLFFCIN